MNFTKADRMCFAKRRFPNLIKAHCALGKMLGQYPENAQKQWRVYQCPVCAGFHASVNTVDAK